MKVSGRHAPAAAVTEDGPDAWRQDGLCRQIDPELWFPEKGGSTREAKRLCGECPVTAECLEYALSHDERFGIWGGLSEPDRRKLRPSVAVRSRAPRRHPERSANPVLFPCPCGAADCKGLVSKTTLQRHRARARRLGAQSVAA